MQKSARCRALFLSCSRRDDTEHGSGSRGTDDPYHFGHRCSGRTHIIKYEHVRIRERHGRSKRETSHDVRESRLSVRLFGLGRGITCPYEKGLGIHELMGEPFHKCPSDECCMVNASLAFSVWVERCGDKEEGLTFHPEHRECSREMFRDEIGEWFRCIADAAVFQCVDKFSRFRRSELRRRKKDERGPGVAVRSRSRAPAPARWALWVGCAGDAVHADITDDRVPSGCTERATAPAARRRKDDRDERTEERTRSHTVSVHPYGPKRSTSCTPGKTAWRVIKYV